MSKRGGFQELFFSTIMPKVYGIGAAVVIVGAMFKLLHITGAGLPKTNNLLITPCLNLKFKKFCV